MGGGPQRAWYHHDMEFNPEDGARRSGFELLPAGIYDIEVLEAEERVSQKGNQMVALTLTASHPEGYESRVWDYLVSTPAAVFKIRMFCEAADLMKQFDSGRLQATDCIGRRLAARIGVEPGRDGYSDRNTIIDYQAPGTKTPAGISTRPETEESAVAATVPAPAPITDDEIPF